MLTRRLFFAASGAALWLPAVAGSATNAYHFTLGVASGSPREDGVVLWTRLAPEPLKGGGMPQGPVQVRYRLCADPAMKLTIRDGLYTTSEAVAHSVHVILKGLEPGREYWYQFYYGQDESPIGRTRTLSRNDQTVRLALASCQSYESGLFTAFADMAAWGPDCVIHVGDYIYEGGTGTLGTRMRDIGGGKRQAFETVRLRNSAEIVTLWDYRNRYALYKSDQNLQAAHAASPWIVAMDDHEIDNNWAGETPQDPEAQTALEFKLRKLAAFQAYYEHMPIERPPVLNGLESALQMYARYRFGPAQVNLIDTRQFRTDQACGDNRKAPCAALDDPARTMTGQVQERWLLESLKSSDAAFNVLASQTWFSPLRYNSEPDAPVRNLDQWDGYPLQRQRLIDAMAQSEAKSIVLSGDWHCAAMMSLHQEATNPSSKKIGHEFAGTSISSHCPWAHDVADAREANPHFGYVNGHQRGYLRHTVTKDDWLAEYRVVADPGVLNAAVSTDAAFHTKDM